jgi:hypothetical protein
MSKDNLVMSISENPFRVHTPEALSAEEVVQLYVTEMPGADAVQAEGHTMLVGSRGSGKSMMLRFLEPDCQALKLDQNRDLSQGFEDIRFFSLYTTIKQTDLIYPELSRLAGTFGDRAINEHFFILVVVLKAVSRCLEMGTLEFLKGKSEGLKDSKLWGFIEYLSLDRNIDAADYFDLFCLLKDCLSDFYAHSLEFLESILEDPHDMPKFKRPLLRFSTFFLPFLNFWRVLPGMPDSGRMFVIIDDADYLNDMQTQVLNTYISTRQAAIFFKVATEVFQYKTYRTLDNRKIEVPHDFSEINTIDIYTSNNTKNYLDRMTNIVNKRLRLFNHIKSYSGRIANAEQYFPEDAKQRKEIDQLKMIIREGGAELPSGATRKRDDAYRYATPEYIRQLGGNRKSRSTYSYSGFRQLVNISSGVPRYFLEAAYLMYDRMKSSDNEFLAISASVQDTVVREQADRIMMEELERLKLSDTVSDGSSDTAVLLHNLVVSLGSLFEKALLDKSLSERRYFSFALSDTPDDTVSNVLRFGVRNSLFTRTSIGRKEGFGRTHRYILTRRLAPYFTLDPNGFSAYKFLTNQEIREMMTDPDRYRRSLRSRPIVDEGIGPLFAGEE